MHLLRTLLAFLFPPSDNETIVRALTLPELQKKCRAKNIPHGHALFQYSDKNVRALIWQVKYRNDTIAIRLLGDVVRRFFEATYKTAYIIVPVPLSTTREKMRGYNQVVKVLEYALHDSLSMLVRNAVVRTRDTVPQTSLTRKARLVNLVGAFEVPENARALIAGKNCVLVDDVVTTGATLAEVREVLLHSGALSVNVLAFAH